MADPPRDSSSVIIVRSGVIDEALLIRRHADLAFAGGAWVFPGGKSEPADASAETLEKLGLAGEPSPGLKVTACRETFEETGIVLAQRADGEPCDAALAESLQRFRAEVSKDAGLFASVLVDHGLTIDPKRLLLWAHWITPSLATRRFDTRFFVAVMPPGQTVRCDSAEATELEWLDLRGGKILPDASFVQAPPTRFSLGDLAICLRQYGSMERLLEAEAGRPVAAVIPRMLKNRGSVDRAAALGSGVRVVAGRGHTAGLTDSGQLSSIPLPHAAAANEWDAAGIAMARIALLGLLAFWAGLWNAAQRYPSEYDWRFMTISSLVYPDRNPDGYAWAWGGLLLCALGGLCWTAVLFRRRCAGAFALALGYGCMACCTWLPRLLPGFKRGHDLLAVAAFVALCTGVTQLTFSLAQQSRWLRKRAGSPWLYAGLLAAAALSPIVMTAVTQAYVSHARPDLPWVGLVWRARGAPVWLSFAFWEWIACAVFSIYLVSLCIATGRRST